MTARLAENLKATRLQRMLEALGPSWTLTELQELAADLGCVPEAALASEESAEPRRTTRYDGPTAAEG